MTHALIALNYQSRGADVIYDNIRRAGETIDKIVWVDQEGISAAINLGLAQTYPDYDVYTIMANDIVEPDYWLSARTQALAGNIAMVSIKLDQEPDHFQIEEIIANYSIRKEVIDAIGGFNTVYDPYGPIDLDYCHRARAAGFLMSYIPGFMSKHKETADRDTTYGYSKQEKVKEKWDLLVNNLREFKPTVIPI
jgi:hypothetical protein